MLVADELRALEEKLLQASVRQDAAQVNALLADEFREVGVSGRFYDKEEILYALREETPMNFMMQDFACAEPGGGVALVTYRSVRNDGVSALRSSLWVWRGKQWLMLFHQGTRVAE